MQGPGSEVVGMAPVAEQWLRWCCRSVSDEGAADAGQGRGQEG